MQHRHIAIGTIVVGDAKTFALDWICVYIVIAIIAQIQLTNTRGIKGPLLNATDSGKRYTQLLRTCPASRTLQVTYALTETADPNRRYSTENVIHIAEDLYHNLHGYANGRIDWNAAKKDPQQMRAKRRGLMLRLAGKFANVGLHSPIQEFHRTPERITIESLIKECPVIQRGGITKSDVLRHFQENVLEGAPLHLCDDLTFGTGKAAASLTPLERSLGSMVTRSTDGAPPAAENTTPEDFYNSTASRLLGNDVQATPGKALDRNRPPENPPPPPDSGEGKNTDQEDDQEGGQPANKPEGPAGTPNGGTEGEAEVPETTPQPPKEEGQEKKSEMAAKDEDKPGSDEGQQQDPETGANPRP
jgi:hypothetical protein